MRSVIVRPDAFQEIHLGPVARFDMARGKVVVIGKGDMKKHWVSTDEVAALVAAAALEPDAPRVIEFGGPEAISRNEAIAVAERLTGRKFRRQRIPAPVAMLAMRVLVRPNDALASVFGTGLMLDLIEPRWDDSPLQQRGITSRSASEFLEQQAGAL